MFPSAATKHHNKSTLFLQGKEIMCIKVIFGTKNKGTFSYVFISEHNRKTTLLKRIKMTSDWLHVVGIDSGSQKNHWDVTGCVTARCITITIKYLIFD